MSAANGGWLAFVAIRPCCSRCVNVCVCRRVYGPMPCLVLWWGTAEEEQFTCTEVRMAGTQMPLLTRAELATGFSSHAYQRYHSRCLVASRVLPLSCVVLLSE